MKRTFTLKCGTFGTAQPKICVPIVAEEQTDIWEKAETIAGLSADVVEWRVDFYKDVFVKEKVLETLDGLNARLNGKDLLFTFRTKGEGGNLAIEKDVYYELNRMAALSGCVSLVDIEAFLDEERTSEEIQKLHSLGCRVITSNHDFYRTPSVQTMVKRLVRMEEMGADVAKIAVMPKCRRDVLRLLEASVEADELIGIPLITMSMGSLGIVSRVAGSLTGSAMTFATAGAASAPGQIPAEQVAEVLKVFE